MSSTAYANLLPQAMAGNLAIPGDTLKMGLLAATYTPNPFSDVHWSDISGHEISGPGYTAGGQTLASVQLNLTAANSWGHPWAAASSYLYGDLVRPAVANGLLYMCVQAGSSGGSAPTWPPTAGLDVTDSGVVWLCIGPWVTIFTSAAPVWATATFDASWGSIYDTASGVLICTQDLGGPQTPSSQNFQVVPDPQSGWLVFPPL